MKRSKILLAVVCGVLILPLVAVGFLNLAKFAIYSEYYSVKTDICKNPGLGDGFVCQGICYYDPQEKILVSGYMKNGENSRIYVTDTDDDSYYVIVKYGSEKDFTGHSGGIAISRGYAYVASGDKIYGISLDDILSAQNGEEVRISKIIPVNNAAAFIFADEDHVYVGEYHDGKEIFTDHLYDTPNGAQYAIVTRYTSDEISAYHKTQHPTVTPDRIYSIRNNVQGMCVTPDGDIVLCTSYGIDSTYYYVYAEADVTPLGATLDVAPVYYLGYETRRIKGPAMGEGIALYGDSVITLSESASDKYVFGKLFFADKIVLLDFD